MYKNILGALYCPVCKGKFQLEERKKDGEEIIEGTLICQSSHRYAIRAGVIDFGSEEQDGLNQWSELFKENDYEELDRKIEQEKSAKEREQQQMLLEAIVEKAEKLENGMIVDVASGRGMLLTKLAARLKESVNLVATDLSFEVLMYDRMKLKKINPELKVNYIACDATAMPLKCGVADMTVSFFGIANMIGIVENGIKEASRITKEDGKLLNAYVVIKEESQGFKEVKKLCDENTMSGAERTCLDVVTCEMHGTYFKEVVAHQIVEGIWEPEENKLDLLPYPGEWYAYMLYEGKK